MPEEIVRASIASLNDGKSRGTLPYFFSSSWISPFSVGTMSLIVPEW